MKKFLRLLSFALILLLTLSFSLPSLAATDPTTKKVLLWSLNIQNLQAGQQMTTPDDYYDYDGNGTPHCGYEAYIYAYKASGVTVDNQILNTSHFAAGTDLAKDYGLVVIYLPGEELNSTDIAVLKKYVDKGGRILMQGENPWWTPTQNEILSKAASDLGTSFTITTTGDYEMSSVINQDSNIISNAGHEVTSIIPDYISKIDYSSPALCVAKTTTEGNPFIVDQAVSKGRITVMSDINFFDPDYLMTPSVINFFYNLLADSVKNMDTVKKGEDPNKGFDPTYDYPETGDSENIALLGIALLLCAGCALVLGKRRRAN